MGNQYQCGDELIPGYRITSYLGRGGFGEVWRAAGPGGVEVAIKTIHDLDRKKGGRELKALRLLKNIRHPNLVPLTGFWLRSASGELLADSEDVSTGEELLAHGDVRGTMTPEIEPLATLAPAAEAVELIIAMGLCESSLTDRLEQCQAEGLRAVPFDELLTYMEDTARAIDLLNTKHDIQHCDIKPQNILLLSGAAQVADFGLAKMIGDIRESSMGAGTIAYGAPEVLIGAGPSHATDQYSLAISYFELRTGRLPFGSDRISEVLAAKQDGEIDLTVLPPEERAVIARATSLKPADRFANCAEMVQALREHGSAKAKLGRAVETDAGSRDRTVRLGMVPARKWWASPALAVSIVSALAIGATIVFTSGSNESDLAPQQQAAARLPLPEDLGTVENRDSAAVPPDDRATVAPDATAALVEQNRAGEEIVTPAIGVADALEQRQEGISTAVADRINAAVQSTNETNERIAESTAETAANTRALTEIAEKSATANQEVAEAAVDISRTLSEIREQLARAADHEALITAPDTPSDFYHNARMYQSRGDYLNARRSYSRLLDFQLNVLDPHLEFQRILRIQDGTAAVREVYQDLAAPEENRAMQIARILSEPASVRRDRLSEFLANHPTYPPAVYYLSEEYSQDKLGVQGLKDMAQEKKLLDRFQQLVNEGLLLEHFLDQSHAIKMVEDTEQRLAALKAFDAAAFEHPVQLTGMMSNTSWSVNLAISEVAREVSYRLSEAEPFQPTGFNSFVDQRTGSPTPRMTFQLPLRAERTKIWVKYVDIRGTECGPFELHFDPETERVRSGKQILTQLPHAWISFRLYEGQLLAYFTHLQSYRYALTEIRYSIDSDALDQVFPLGRVDPSRPFAVQEDTLTFLTVPGATRLIAVHLTFGDGTKSELRRFEYQGARPTELQQPAASVPAGNQNTGPAFGGQNRGGNSPLERVDVNIDPTFRRAPRVRFGFGF